MKDSTTLTPTPIWINTLIRLDAETGRVLEREGYWYDGPLALCSAPALGSGVPAASGPDAGAGASASSDDGAGTPAAGEGASAGTGAEVSPEPPAEAPGTTIEEREAVEVAETPQELAAGEEPPAEKTPEEIAAERAAQAAEAAKPPSEMDKALNEAYRDHPELKEFLKAHPQLKPQWFFASQVQREGFKTLDDVKAAKEAFDTLTDFDSLYYSEKPEDSARFVDQLWKNSLRDPAQPHHPQTNPSTGNFERVAERIVSDTLSRLLTLAQNRSQLAGWTPEQAKIAVEGVAKMLQAQLRGEDGAGLGVTPAQGAPASPAESRLRAREAALEARERELRTTADEHFQNEIQSGFQSFLTRELDLATKPIAALLAKQPKGVQNSVREQIVTRVAKAVEQDTVFYRQFETRMRAGNRGPEHLEQLNLMLEQRGAHYFPTIANEVFSEFGLSLANKQATVTARQQQAASRVEPSTSGSPGRLSGAPTRAPVKPTGVYRKDAEKLLWE